MADGDEPKRIVGERAPGAVTCHDHVSALLFVANLVAGGAAS